MFSNLQNLHSLHPYPCKFPSSVASRFITEKGVLLDPYCGSGTTLLEGAIRGLDVFGFDCNPIAQLISKCKLVELTSSEVKSLKTIETSILDGTLHESIGLYSLPDFPGKDHWFSNSTQEEFSVLLSELSRFDRESSQWLVLATVISSLVVTFSNQDSETRYAAVEKNHKRGDLLNSAGKKLYKTLNALEDRGSLRSAKREVFLGDIRNGIDLPDNFVTQVITSPPYANTMDYYLYHKQRMNLLGYDFKITQNREIGSRHEFSSKRQDVGKWNNDYLIGMREIARVLSPGGRAIFVIGDSQLAGKHIDGGQLTLNSAKTLGLSAKIIESVPMTGKSKTFRSSFQSPNKYEHIVEIRK